VRGGEEKGGFSSIAILIDTLRSRGKGLGKEGRTVLLKGVLMRAGEEKGRGGFRKHLNIL